MLLYSSLSKFLVVIEITWNLWLLGGKIDLENQFEIERMVIRRKLNLRSRGYGQSSKVDHRKNEEPGTSN
jgi:hypothetical protein